MEILLGLLTFVVIALALALAPGRWRRSRPQAARPAAGWAGSRPAAFLGVCGRCAEIVEGNASVRRCPYCGSDLVVRQPIVSRRRVRARAMASR